MRALAESGGRDGAWPKDEGVPGFPAFRTCLWATPQAVAVQFLRQHDGSSHYKALLKGLLKTALENVNAQVTTVRLSRSCTEKPPSPLHKQSPYGAELHAIL